MGMIHATIGEHKEAVLSCMWDKTDEEVAMYVEATKLDQYLAVAYFQEGVSNFLLGEFEEALANFNDALLVIPFQSSNTNYSISAGTFISIMNNWD